MNNIVSNQQNQRFSKVQEELKRFLSIITYSVENNNENNFDYIIENSNNPEDIRIAEVLKQDELDRENRIKYQSEKTKKAKEKLENKTLSVEQPRKKVLSNEQIKKVEKIIEKSDEER